MSDFDVVRRAFAALTSIPDAEFAALAAGSRIVALRKGEMLVRQGEPAAWLGCLTHGVARLFCNRGGVEANLGFELAGGFVGDYAGYMQRGAATQSQQALAPSRAVVMPRALLDRLLAGHPCWRELAGRTAEAELLKKMRIDTEARTLSAEDRYAALVEQRSPLLQHVPLYHLASWLGVTPETLSRIRARRASVVRPRRS